VRRGAKIDEIASSMFAARTAKTKAK